MLEAYEFSAWDHTASLLACVVGLVKQGVKVDQFHPYRRMNNINRNRATVQTLVSLKSSLPKWREPDE